MALKLYNTLTRRKDDFVPLEDRKVKMYSCGPTVYNYAHIGNLRTYIFADVLQRTLKYLDYDVTGVMNVTDVGHLTSDEDVGEDKLEAGARREGRSVWDIARFYEDAFFRDIEKLNIEPPTIVARATEHISEMVALVQRLESQGYAYPTDQAVYFEVSKFPDYTKLAGQAIEDKIVGAREAVQADPQKRNPADFALWFKAVGRFANHIMQWDSPWGPGFPGWHVECSAMSMKYLGDTLDIHTGGIDHIPVHHTNEIAQSEAATGKQFARWWMHGEFLVMFGGGKMAKSEGTFITLQNLIDKGYDPLAYRYLSLTVHYRSKLNFYWESLDAAREGYNRLKLFVETAAQRGGEVGEWTEQYRERFRRALEDDLNMPQALAAAQELVREANSRNEPGALEVLYDFDLVLGLGLKEIGKAAVGAELPSELEALIREREAARKEKNWGRADEIRAELAAKGITIEDRPEGTIWRRA